MKEYIMFDVDKIKDFVFDSFKPKDVNGASEMIKALDFFSDGSSNNRELMTKLRKDFPGTEVVYSKGGGGLLFTPNGNGEKICKWLEDSFEEHVDGASLTAVCHSDEGDFQSAYAILNYKVRQRKNDKIMKRKLESVSFVSKEDRCRACGKRKAAETVVFGEGPDTEKLPYCSVCYQKRENGESLKTEPIKGNVLIIYGDLNAAGNYLSEIKDTKKLKNFSDTVYQTLEDTREQIKAILNEHKFYHLMPVAGGDDMVIFTHPAAFSLIKDKLFRIEEILTRKLGQNMYMNFSLLVTKQNFPIYHQFRISEELLKKTKDRFYEKNDRQTYYGFFQLREGEYLPQESDVYTKGQFKSLFDFACILHKNDRVKTSNLHTIMELLESHFQDAEREMHMDYYFERQSWDVSVFIEKDNASFRLKDGEKHNLKVSTWEDILNFRDLMYEFYDPAKERNND